MGNSINLNIENKENYRIPSKSEIEEEILKVLNEKSLNGSFEVDIKFVDAHEIHGFNNEYRDIDKPTDVLSFPIQEKDVILSAAKNLTHHGHPEATTPKDLKPPVLLGDIIICPEMAKEPILKLIEHSTLHLLGFHHKGD